MLSGILGQLVIVGISLLSFELGYCDGDVIFQALGTTQSDVTYLISPGTISANRVFTKPTRTNG